MQHQQQPPPYPPPQGHYPPPPAGGVIITTPVIAVGGCPSCRAGVLSDEFTCCGILLAILFFPVGIICCWVMRSKRCTNCGATFD